MLYTWENNQILLVIILKISQIETGQVIKEKETTRKEVKPAVVNIKNIVKNLKVSLPCTQREIKI